MHEPRRPADRRVACRAAGIPLIVDAAAQLPPKENLRRFIAMGVDLVAFSGGKALGGPQASGSWLANAISWRRAAVAAASTWTWRPRPGRRPSSLIAPNLRGVPHHGIGRGFKAGKEEIIGLLTASIAS